MAVSQRRPVPILFVVDAEEQGDEYHRKGGRDEQEPTVGRLRTPCREQQRHAINAEDVALPNAQVEESEGEQEDAAPEQRAAHRDGE